MLLRLLFARSRFAPRLALNRILALEKIIRHKINHVVEGRIRPQLVRSQGADAIQLVHALFSHVELNMQHSFVLVRYRMLSTRRWQLWWLHRKA
ncbi:MAG TPA: hypothetical protein VJS69_00310 [Candidatus Krumholzibacteria bacterium]|nr:hypothetical protein [Candidatus Krumholzibacteria bacterium]